MTKRSPYYKHALEMEKIHTPWFLPETIMDNEKENLIDTINANKYEFYKNGTMYSESYFEEVNHD